MNQLNHSLSSDNNVASNVSKITAPSYKVSLTGTILLILTLFTTAAILPLQVALPLDITILKLSWRNCNMIPFLFLLSIYDIFTKSNQFQIQSLVTNKEIRNIVICTVISFNLMQCGYILSGQYTIMSHASILSNLGGVFLVIFRILARKPVHKFELLGLFLAISGSFVSVLDKDIQKVDQSSLNIFVGDISGIISSLTGAFYYQFNAKLVSKIPSSVAVFSTIFVSEIMIIIFGLLTGLFTFDRDKMTGVWGFMNAEYILYTLFLMGLLCGTISIYTAALVLKYYPPIVLMIVSLMEPIICQVLSCLMKIDRAPGLLTYAGGIITLFGIFGVGYGGQILEKNMKKVEALELGVGN